MKWEYKIAYINTNKLNATSLPENLNIEFNKWGEEGWELVKVEPVIKGGYFFFLFGSFSYTESFIAFFKKEVQL